jgi:hypothetical protein
MLQKMHRLPRPRDNWEFVSNSHISLVMRTVRIDKLSYYSCCSQTGELIGACRRLEESKWRNINTTNLCPSINPTYIHWMKEVSRGREFTFHLSSCTLERLWSPSEGRHLLIGHRNQGHFDSTCFEDLADSGFTTIGDQYTLQWFNRTEDNMIS